MNANPTTVAVAMSGGVDSAVAASLLLEGGYEVLGLWMQLRATGSLDLDAAYQDALRAAHVLGIPLTHVNLQLQFERAVVACFLEEYRSGNTPNPCARCNPEIKFGALMAKGLELGAERFATGHYARVTWDSSSERFVLLRGIDRRKDQSYFLWGLSQGQLARCVFPNGSLMKKEVLQHAKRRGLPVTERGESQEICFIPRGDYRLYIQERLGNNLPSGGEIVDQSGRILGKHRGIFNFTIGQRRRIGIPADKPLYVTKIDSATNRVVVGQKEDLSARKLVARGMNWVSVPDPRGVFRAKGKIRYRHSETPCTVVPCGNDTVEVRFDEPQEAITPGQALVLYDGPVLLGGGWIRDVCDE